MPDIFDELAAWSSGGTATKTPPMSPVGRGDIFSELSSWASQPVATPKEKTGPSWEPLRPRFLEPDDAPDVMSRPQFSSEVTEPRAIEGAIGAFAKAVPRGAASTAGAAIEGTGLVVDELANLMGRDPDLKELALTSLGRGIQSKAAAMLPPSGDPRYELVEGLGEGLGSGAAALPLAAVGGVPAIAALGGTAGYSTLYRQVKDAGGTDEDARIFARAGGLVGAVTEPLGSTMPTVRILKRLDKGTKGWLGREIAKAGTGEAFEEAVQEIPNEVARHAYDKERTLIDSLEAVQKSGAMGGIVGTILAGTASAIRNKAVPTERATQPDPLQPGESEIPSKPAVATPGIVGMGENLVGSIVASLSPQAKSVLLTDHESRASAGQKDPTPSNKLFTESGAPDLTRKVRAAVVEAIKQENANAQNVQNQAAQEVHAEAETSKVSPVLDTLNEAYRSELQYRSTAREAQKAENPNIFPPNETSQAIIEKVRASTPIGPMTESWVREAVDSAWFAGRMEHQWEKGRLASEVYGGVARDLNVPFDIRNYSNAVDLVKSGAGGSNAAVAKKALVVAQQLEDAIVNAIREVQARPVSATQKQLPPPAEVEAQGADVLEPRTTSIKNAVVDEERAKRGLRPAMEPSRRSFGKVWDDAMETVERNPVRQDALIAELAATPRAVTDLEDALLLHRQVTLQNEYDKVADELDTDLSKVPLDRIAELEFQEETLSQKLLELYDINKAVGTETGRGLNARRMMALEDFTLAKMLARKRKAKGGLSTEDRVEVAAQQRKIADLEKRLGEHQTRIETLEAEKASTEAFKLTSEAPKKAVSKRKAAAKLDIDAALANFTKVASGKLFSNPIDPEVIGAAVQVAAAYLKSGVATVADFLDAVKARIGADKLDKSRETLTAAWQQAVESAKPKNRTALENPDQIRRYASKLAEHYVSTGIRERDAVIDAVHSDLQAVLPDLTRRETMDAISGYGHFQPLSKDEIKVALRDLKGQMQQVGKIEDMQAKIAPRKTGPERRTPSAIEKQLIKAVNELKKTGDFQSTEDTLQTALATFKKRTQSRIDDYQKRLADGDFAKRTRKPLQLDAAAEKLRFEVEQAKADFLRGLEADRQARRTKGEKIIEGGAEVLNTSRAILTSMDFSAVGRQGGMLALSHPLLAKNAGKEMFKSFASEAAESRVMNEIANRKNSSLYKRAKLALTGIHGRLSQQEEAYMSQWARNIPGVAGSERAYVTFLNMLRADAFDSMVASLGRSGSVTDAEAAVIANYVNVATGRGDLGKATQAATWLATVFFAPKYVSSRFQLLTGQPLRKSGNTWRTRKLIATEYARSLGGLGLFYGTMGVALTALLGVPGKDEKWGIETDPRSSDFGKIRIGNSRIDPMMGLQQAAVLLSRLTSGQTKSLSGKIQPIRGDKVPYGGANSVDVVARFLRTKLSPLLGTAANLLVGKDVVGQPVTAGGVAQSLAVPLSFRDIYAAMKEQGIPGGTALSLLNMFGVAVQTYTDKFDKAAQNETRRRLGLKPIP